MVKLFIALGMVVVVSLVGLNRVSGQGNAGMSAAPMPNNSSGPLYDGDGNVLRPTGWRKWVYVGTPLTPHDMNDGKAAFPEFHNVYMDPHSFEVFSQTGEFPNGTQLVKELVMVGSKGAASGSGYFMGEFSGLELTIKDTVRFKDQPGGWAYFSFGHTAVEKYAPSAKAMPAEKCNACHESSADLDFVFIQYYPVLRAAMPMKKLMQAKEMSEKGKMMDASAVKAAMGAMGGASDAVMPDKFSDKLFAWLKSGAYKEYAGDSKVHKSVSVHGGVRIFANPKLSESMKAGNASHPVGSIAVKELYRDGKMLGWATAVKTKDGQAGNGWHWYENLSLENNDSPVVSGMGARSCIGCHSGGSDFVRFKGFQ